MSGRPWQRSGRTGRYGPHAAFVDALRACLDLPPLYAPDQPSHRRGDAPTLRRFYRAETAWRPDGMRGRVGSGA